MKIDIELGKVKVRIPENKADLPVNVIVGDGGSGPEPGPGVDRIHLHVTEFASVITQSYTIRST